MFDDEFTMSMNGKKKKKHKLKSYCHITSYFLIWITNIY